MMSDGNPLSAGDVGCALKATSVMSTSHGGLLIGTPPRDYRLCRRPTAVQSSVTAIIAQRSTVGSNLFHRGRKLIIAAQRLQRVPGVKKNGRASALVEKSPRKISGPPRSSSVREQNTSTMGTAPASTREKKSFITKFREIITRETSTLESMRQEVSGRSLLVPKLSEEKAEPQTTPQSPLSASSLQTNRRGLAIRFDNQFISAREKKSEDLFRGIPVLPGHLLCPEFELNPPKTSPWSSSACSEEDFSLSQPTGKIDWFVSHAWARDRRDPMFRSAGEYTTSKTMELQSSLNDIWAKWEVAEGEGSEGTSPRVANQRVDPITLWIDKFCISPDVLERRVVIERHIEFFLANSKGLLVLLNTSYFRRLWCVYEWGVFIATHGSGTLDKIRVCLFWLCSNAAFQIPLLARGIECMSVVNLKCSQNNDTQHLQSIISTKYQSLEQFQRMVQISALCALARACAELAFDFCTPGAQDLQEAWRVFDLHLEWRHTKYILPWKTTAETLGLNDVASGVQKFWGQVRQAGIMAAKGLRLDDGSGLFCVSAPSRNRLEILARRGAKDHLACLVDESRATAIF
ncbi:unnamed protein product [Ascophyllum nodosum]